MSTFALKSSQVAATVVKVMPMTGLAYLDGDDHRPWTITKSTTGTGLGCLRPGLRVRLTVQHEPSCEFVSEYRSLD